MKFLSLVAILFFSTSAYSSELDYISTSLDLSATVEDVSEFEGSALEWVHIDDEYTQALTGNLKIKNNSRKNFGPININVENGLVQIGYGFNVVSVSVPAGCNSTCEQTVNFWTDDGDYPVGGNIIIKFFLKDK